MTHSLPETLNLRKRRHQSQLRRQIKPLLRGLISKQQIMRKNRSKMKMNRMIRTIRTTKKMTMIIKKEKMRTKRMTMALKSLSKKMTMQSKIQLVIPTLKIQKTIKRRWILTKKKLIKLRLKMSCLNL